MSEMRNVRSIASIHSKSCLVKDNKHGDRARR